MNGAVTLQHAEVCLLSGDLHEARTGALSLAAFGTGASSDNLLALIEVKEGNRPRAIQMMEQALARDPGQPVRWHNLGLLHCAVLDWELAEAVFCRGLEANPANAALLADLARAHLETGRAEEALARFGEAYRAGAEPLVCAFGIARALTALGRSEGAIALLEEVAGEAPDSAIAHQMLADLYTAQAQLHLVLCHRKEVFRLRPLDVEAQLKLSAAYWDSGHLELSLQLSEPLARAGVVPPAFHAFYVSALLHRSGQTAESLRKAHERWAEVHAAGIVPFADWPGSLPDGDRRLRLAYMGGDLYENPSFHFLYPFFRHHDRDAFEISCYDIRARNDAHTERVRELCDVWISCAGVSTEDLARRIREDGIDILIDTTGHFSGNRVCTAAYRPAPVQIALLNYPATTGLMHFDAILTDAWVSPPGLDDQYTEPAIRLASGFLPYEPPATAPPVSPLPAMRNGFITFGLFQRPVKLGTAMWDLVAQVLSSVPESRLLVHNSFAEVAIEGSSMQTLYLTELQARGVEPGRLLFRGPAGMEEHLGILGLADIALDTFPYNGQTTTCECLWMGVPTVSLTGGYHVARVALSVLSRAGYPEWATDSREAYLQKTCELARDWQFLARLRASMREGVRNSVLMNGAASTRELEAVCRQLWRKRCFERTQKND